jgi:hypothetical protein
MKRGSISQTASIVAIVAIGVAGIAVVTGAFNTTEQATISRMKQRLTAIETRLDAIETQVTAQSSIPDDIAQLYANDQGISSDIDTLNANDATLDASTKTLDAGLKDLIAPDGPLAQLNAELLALDSYVKDAIPPISLTNITPTVTCDGTNCTVDVSWNSDPAATGQVEWGTDLTYGHLTGQETSLLTFHKQRLGTFPQDGKTYHFRVLATTPEAEGISTGSFVAG